jgi:hypothetical protein
MPAISEQNAHATLSEVDFVRDNVRYEDEILSDEI